MLALQNAELVVLGYNTPSKMVDWEDQPHQGMFSHLLSMQAGAYQNSLWVAAAAKCGTEDGHHMIGGSAIIAPSGEIVAKSSTEGDEVIVADIDLNMADNYRQFVFNLPTIGVLSTTDSSSNVLGAEIPCRFQLGIDGDIYI